MRCMGFSTGALALGDFAKGIELQRLDGVKACELSALREEELDPLLVALPDLDLSHFQYLSFHAPSRLVELNDRTLIEKIRPFVDRKIPIVVHPDIMREFEPWQELGDLLLLENMDSRKEVCQETRDLAWYFEQLPQARFCFDIGHARQIDPTMSVATELLLRLRNRLAEIHISEVNWQCHHVQISSTAKWAFRRVARIIPPTTPVIIESLLAGEVHDSEMPKAIRRELAAARASLRPERAPRQSSQLTPAPESCTPGY